MKTIKNLRIAIENEKVRSAWTKGVKMYALELLADLPENYEIFGEKSDRELLLNGAKDWSQYSWGGCSLIYDEDIAERLCTPSELKKTRNASAGRTAAKNGLTLRPEHSTRHAT